MKKFAMLLSALLLGMSFSIPVHAEASADVWYEATVEEDKGLSVSVETNGKATDGVVAISYDPSVLKCTETDVKVADAVEMHSVNVVDEKVKISFLAENPIETGTIAEIAFEVVDENADRETLESAIRLEGEAYNENGEAVAVKDLKEEEPQQPGDGGEDKPQQPGDSGEDKPQQPGDSGQKPSGDGIQKPSGNDGQQTGTTSTPKTPNQVRTGDDTNIYTYLILFALTGALLIAFAAKRVMAHIGKGPGHLTGRKSNH